MGQITVTVKLTHEYGHPGNRPSGSSVLKKIHDELNKICEKQAHEGRGGLAHFYVTGIEVTK